VDDPQRVHLGERVGHFDAELHRLAHRERPAREARFERVALDTLHDEIRPPVVDAGLVHRDHAGVVDARRGLRLAQ